ncbi:hypothetical protein [Paenibacillus paeoniae]|uniref:Uncharacterized protein n=1 Tax=Paenibacillus paeoniae TaxID=2292705 RepID=A0A371P0D0_9BACL|nr:hypothetical protein [Paenibacillus paeoniae]REK69321.1 hypothetical protein DX130_24480 [Paenibacillus paeoniae]
MIGIILSIYILIGAATARWLHKDYIRIAAEIEAEKPLCPEDEDAARDADVVQRMTGGRIVSLTYAMLMLFWLPGMVWALIDRSDDS